MAGVATLLFQTTRSMVRMASVSRVFGTNPTLTQVRIMSSSSDAAKRTIDELKKVTEQIKEKAASEANCAANQSKEAAGCVESVAEKAKKSAQEAWNATKNVAENVQNSVTGKAEATAEHVKDHVNVAKRSMNTKNIK